jgi:hypothetical protein
VETQCWDIPGRDHNPLLDCERDEQERLLHKDVDEHAIRYDTDRKPLKAPLQEPERTLYWILESPKHDGCVLV